MRPKDHDYDGWVVSILSETGSVIRAAAIALDYECGRELAGVERPPGTFKPAAVCSRTKDRRSNENQSTSSSGPNRTIAGAKWVAVAVRRQRRQRVSRLFYLAFEFAAGESVRQILVEVRAAAAGALVFAGASGRLVRVLLEVRTLLPSKGFLVSTLKGVSASSAAFQLLSGTYSYFPTQFSVTFGAAGSSGTSTHRPA